MKYLLIGLFLIFKLVGIAQNAPVKLNIIITDTVKPYFLDIYIYKGNTLIKKMTVITSGIYLIKDLNEGDYNLEFHSFQTSARRLNLTNVHFTKDSVNELSITYPLPCKFIYSKNYKPICLYNHTDSIVRIVYGYPTHKTMKKANKGLIHLGGCTVTNCDPKYYCAIHKIEL